MAVKLETMGAGKVAILHGVDTDAAVTHLSHSLVEGPAFDGYRALVVDLSGSNVSPSPRAALQGAAIARRRGKQWVSVATDTAGVAAAVRDARQWMQLVDRHAAAEAAAVVGATAIGVVAASITVARNTARSIATKLAHPARR